MNRDSNHPRDDDEARRWIADAERDRHDRYVRRQERKARGEQGCAIVLAVPALIVLALRRKR